MTTPVRELDRRHLWHPYTQHFEAPEPRVVTRAEGAYVYDDGGRRIFDAISSWWVTLHGHAHPVIAAAVGRQACTLEQVIFAGFTHEPAARLAAALSGLLPPGLTRVFFSDDGSTAVEAALKMALQFWTGRGERRPLIAALEHAYHGDTFGAMAASARGVFTAPFADHLFEVARLPDPSEDGAATVAALDHLLDARGADLAAVIVEPLLLGAGGMRVWEAATLRAIRERTARAGVLLIADEVLTGFGRTGPHFACARADVVPDIICLSKGLTGGFLPLGATVTCEEIFAAFLSPDRRRTFFHGHSYTANPIACAAALASLSLLDDASARARAGVECAQQMGLARLAGHPRVSRCRGIGTIAAFDLDAEPGYLSTVGQELAAYALRAGVLLRPLGNVVYLLPPYCSTADDLEHAYDVIENFLGGDMIRLGVTGTDTGVGKTVIAVALVTLLRRRGLHVAAMKPVETGVLPGTVTDAARLRAAAGGGDEPSDVGPVTYGEPLAPLVAADRARRPVDVETLDVAFARLSAGRDAIVVEGAGGLLVPLTETVSYAEIFARWHLGIVVVAANRLGAINHVLLTVHAARAAELRVRGVVLNSPVGGVPDAAAQTNAGALARLLPGIPVLSWPWLPDVSDDALVAHAERLGLGRLVDGALPTAVYLNTTERTT